MENNSQNKESFKIVISSGKLTNIWGVSKVISATENAICFVLNGKNAYLQGSNLHVLKLDTDQKIVDIEGEISMLKLNGTKQSKNFFKKLFS